MEKQRHIRDFLARVNKLSVGRSTADPEYGLVTCIKAADYSRGFNKFLNRSGYGTRKFSVAKSEAMYSGKYTLGGLRNKIDSYAYYFT